jgi:hypothetical protein
MIKYVVISLAVIAALTLFFYMHKTPTILPTAAAQTVTIGTTTLQVEVESTEAAREQGLSGRTSLPEGTGMLFVFQQDGNWGFWMKDMNFPIDIIFISATPTPGAGTVVSVAPNASPEGYHQNPPQVFYPPTAVRYVLEVPAGFAAAHGVVPGTTLQFNL